MPFKVELTLGYEENYWIAKNNQIHLTASELSNLDTAVKKEIKQLQLFPEGSRVEVYMNFNQAYIPEWMRQYANHYFNRKITFTI